MKHKDMPITNALCMAHAVIREGVHHDRNFQREALIEIHNALRLMGQDEALSEVKRELEILGLDVEDN